jgi:transposase
VSAAVIELRTGTRVWIVAGVTDLRRGFTGLSAMVQTTLEQDPFSGHVFVFRGRRGDLIKALWWGGDGLCLLAKRLERGRFIWPQATSGSVALTRAQLSMLLEGIDWRHVERSQVSNMFHVNVSSATLPQSQGLESLLLSRNTGSVPTISSQFQSV